MDRCVGSVGSMHEIEDEAESLTDTRGVDAEVKWISRLGEGEIKLTSRSAHQTAARRVVSVHPVGAHIQRRLDCELMSGLRQQRSSASWWAPIASCLHRQPLDLHSLLALVMKQGLSFLVRW